MIIRSIRRFFEGRVKFSAQGGFEDLFLRACRDRNAALFRLRIAHGIITAETKTGDAEKIRCAAADAGMELVFSGRRGFGALLSGYRMRFGIPIGLAAAALVFQILASVLWSVEISGCRAVREEDVSRALNVMNVKKGTFLTHIDCAEIEYTLSLLDPAVARVTVNLAGCKLFVDISERVIPPEIRKGNRYCNIIALRDGEVLRADFLAGEGTVHPGDAVCKGDLLVEGRQTLLSGEERLFEAKAHVIARTKHELSCQTAQNVNVSQVRKVKDRFSVCFFGLLFPPAHVGAKEIASYLCSKNSVFPVGLMRSRETDCEAFRAELSAARAELICITDLAAAALRDLENAAVVNAEVRLLPEGQICADACFICEEDIAQQQFFQTAQ